jgi:4,5-dihydroxyphthalate decarboxylase
LPEPPRLQAPTSNEENATMTTATRTLKTAIGGYGHHAALKDGSITADGVSFEHIEVAPIINAFRRMCRGQEFDISEMAITTYLAARRYGLPFTAIPVFPVRAFHNNAFAYNTDSGIKEPKDMEGKKVGVRAYTVTTGVWARGIVASDFGVDLDKITWVLADEEHVEQFHGDMPANASMQAGADLTKMLADGELAAGIGIAGREAPENVKPLIADRNAAADWHKRTGIYPINHTVVVKDELLRENPGLAALLFEAWKAAKDKWLAGASAEDKASAGHNIIQGDPFPYGIEANRKPLETIVEYAVQQHILPGKLNVEDLFAEGTKNT